MGIFECYKFSDADQWETVFLPMSMNGKPVLVHVDGNSWRADKSHFSAGERLEYNGSKDMKDKSKHQGLPWGSLVNGIDTGDGWLQTEVWKIRMNGNFRELIMAVARL